MSSYEFDEEDYEDQLAAEEEYENLIAAEEDYEMEVVDWCNTKEDEDMNNFYKIIKRGSTTKEQRKFVKEIKRLMIVPGFDVNRNYDIPEDPKDNYSKDSNNQLLKGENENKTTTTTTTTTNTTTTTTSTPKNKLNEKTSLKKNK